MVLLQTVPINWGASTRRYGFPFCVRSDSSMIASLDCVGIRTILFHVQRSLTGDRWAWTRPQHGGEFLSGCLADGLARDETVRQVPQQSGCVRALRCSLGSPHKTRSSPGPWPTPVSTSTATDPMLWERAFDSPSIRDERLEIIIKRDLGGRGSRKWPGCRRSKLGDSTD